MSITQKILARHLSKDNRSSNQENSESQTRLPDPGEFINADIDLIMVHEQLAGRIDKEYEKLGFESVKNPEKIVYILDHWVPAPDIRAARMHQEANRFAKKYGFVNILGENKGICHTVLPEQGFIYPGMLAIGSDSHTTTYGAFNCFSTGVGATDVCNVFATGQLWFMVPETIRVNVKNQLKNGAFGKDFTLALLRDFKTDGALYKSLEFGGEGLKNLDISSRITLANMSVEMGAKNAVFEFDKILMNWLLDNQHFIERQSQDLEPVEPDKDVNYEKTVEYDLSDISPMVAKPHRPDNVFPVDEIGDITLDQGFIGSCTNGSLEDLRIAAKVLNGNKVKKETRCIVIPASTEIYMNALDEGLIKIFMESGCVVGPSTCGPCIGGHMGVLGDEEVCISTSNRNFRGRMGSKSSKVYLASPATVAASVIEGKIVSPEKYFKNEGGSE